MGTCKSNLSQNNNNNNNNNNRKISKNITIKDVPLFIPPISKYGKIINCVALNHFIVAAYILIPNTPLFSYNIYLNNMHVPNINSINETEKLVATNGIKIMREVFLNKNIILSNLYINSKGNYVADINIDKKNIISISEWLIIHNYGIKKTLKNKNISWYKLYCKRPTLINIS